MYSWISSIIGAVSGMVNRISEIKLAEHNRKENYYWNEKAADDADQRQRAQYKDLYSPEAQMKQYAAAGLSPSMMMSGGQSAIGGTPQGAQGGISGAYPSGNIIDPLTLAQIANINADTEQKKAETKVTEETGKEMALSQIAENYAKAGKADLEKEVLDIDKALKDIELKYADDLASSNLDYAIYKAENMLYQSVLIMSQTEQIDLQNRMTIDTYQENVRNAYLQNAKILSDIAMNNSKIKLNETQIETMLDQIAINAYNANTQRMSYQAQAKWYEDQVNQWMIQNGFTEEQLHNEDVRNWTTFAASVFGSMCNLGGSIVNAVVPN